MRSSALRRIGFLSVSLALGASGLSACSSGTTGSTSPSPSTGTGPRESVTLVLGSSDNSRLAALSHSEHLSKAERTSSLLALAPSAATEDHVASVLAGQGLTVTHRGPWSITASGPESTVTAVVGDLAQLRKNVAVNPADVASGDTSHLLPGLRAYVTGVVGGDDNAPVAVPFAGVTQDGASVQALYQSPAARTGSGHHPVTVATVQFSGWDKSNLTTYAKAQGVPDPVSTGQYVGVSVDGASQTVSVNGGDGEVALDQESILDSAPYLYQRAYFAPSTSKGYLDALLKIANDATDPKSTFDIAAVSISWGMCEQAMGAANINAIHQGIDLLLASGVTVFASTGDDGKSGCAPIGHSEIAAVNYPASDPDVIAVGGTTVHETTSQTGWAGSGGGVSAAFAVPAYQQGLTTQRGRTTPDLAATGDPESGFRIYNHGWDTYGGTSLSSPVSAALFANTLAYNGQVGGVGFIQHLLYAAPAATFTDVVVGNNGYSAGPGYDLVTGRGAPLWSKLAQGYLGAAPTLSTESEYYSTHVIPVQVTNENSIRYTGYKWGSGNPPANCNATGASPTPPTQITAPAQGRNIIWVDAFTSLGYCYADGLVVNVDTVKPVVKVTGQRANPTDYPLIFRWSAVDTSPTTNYAVVITASGSTQLVYANATSATSTRINTVPGKTYTATVTTNDAAGNSGTGVSSITVPYNQTVFSRGAWTLVSSAAAFQKSWYQSAKAGLAVSRKFTGTAFTPMFTTCSQCGKVGLYVDGRLVKTIDTYSATTRYMVGFASPKVKAGTHTVMVKNLGSKNAKSHGIQVRFDAISVAP